MTDCHSISWLSVSMGESKDLENVPFLEEKEMTTVRRVQHRQNVLRRYFLDILAVIALTTVLTTTLLKMYSGSKHHAISGLDVQYNYSAFTSLYVSPFYLDPEASWKALLSPMKIRVSSEELSQQDGHPNSFDLPDGGHLAWLGAYHDLHCLDYIRQSIHGLNDTEHFDHCIDALRQVVMCRPDLETLAVFDWKDNLPTVAKYFPRRHCVNWDRLVDSISSRQVTWREIHNLRD